LGHLMEYGDKITYRNLRDLMHANRIWQQRSDKLPPACD
jgi:hypothetical protein